MPIRPVNNTSIRLSIPQDIPKWIVIDMCRESRKLIKDMVKYRVDEDSNGSLIATFEGNGAQFMNNQIREWIDTYVSETFSMTKQATEFFAVKICQEVADTNVLYYAFPISQYETRIIAIGDDREAFIEAIKEEQQKFLFVDSPMVLCLIIINKMSIKIPRENLKLIPSGKDTIVHPSGANAAQFYQEFYNKFTTFVTDQIREPSLDDKILTGICKEINSHDVYYSVYKKTIVMKGFAEDMLPIIEAIKKKIQTYKSRHSELEEDEVEIEDVHDEYLAAEAGEL